MSEHDLEKTSEVKYAKLEFLGFEARIGRLRYMVWQLGLAGIFIVSALVGLSAVFVSPIISVLILGVGYILHLIFTLRIAAQRLHDLNFSAWMLLLLLVPVVNLIVGIMLLVMPGAAVPNRFGAPPPPNSTSVKITSWVLAFIYSFFIAGIIAIAASPLAYVFINAVNRLSL